MPNGLSCPKSNGLEKNVCILYFLNKQLGIYQSIKYLKRQLFKYYKTFTHKNCIKIYVSTILQVFRIITRLKMGINFKICSLYTVSSGTVRDGYLLYSNHYC